MHIIFGWHTQAHIIGHAATVNLSRVHSVCVTSRGLRIQGPARAPGPSCTTWGVIVSPLDARGAVSGKKWKVSREEGTVWRPLHRLLLEFTLVSPHQRDRRGLICGFACRSPGSFYPPPWGRVWCRLDPRRTETIPPACAHFISAETFFSRKTISKVSQEAETMFCRNQTARATVARGSALEMEIRRGKFRKSVFQDTSQVHWSSASYHYTHINTHAHTGPLGNFQTRTQRHSLWGFVCLQLWLISLLLQTNLFSTRSISHLGVCVLLCAPF